MAQTIDIPMGIDCDMDVDDTKDRASHDDDIDKLEFFPDSDGLMSLQAKTNLHSCIHVYRSLDWLTTPISLLITS